MNNENIPKILAEKLLQIKAIKLQPTNPFTWASGMKSPIYCDNRKILSFPEARNLVRDSFVQQINRDFPSADMIAGVATGAIAHGALVAEAMNLPFIYIRSNPKGHGLENLVEGDMSQGKNVVVVEDLISTGGSSLKAIDALRDEKINVLGLVAIFTYEFDKAIQNFKNANCSFSTLSNYSNLIETAVDTGYISNEQLDLLKKWRNNPDNWLNN
jgi:orotate phosphoribosyltransferase